MLKISLLVPGLGRLCKLCQKIQKVGKMAYLWGWHSIVHVTTPQKHVKLSYWTSLLGGGGEKALFLTFLNYFAQNHRLGNSYGTPYSLACNVSMPLRFLYTNLHQTHSRNYHVRGVLAQAVVLLNPDLYSVHYKNRDDHNRVSLLLVLIHSWFFTS